MKKSENTMQSAKDAVAAGIVAQVEKQTETVPIQPADFEITYGRYTVGATLNWRGTPHQFWSLLTSCGGLDSGACEIRLDQLDALQRAALALQNRADEMNVEVVA